MPKYKVFSEYLDRETNKYIQPGEEINVSGHKEKRLIAKGVIREGDKVEQKQKSGQKKS